MMPQSYQVAIADDHDFLREGLRSILERSDDFEVMVEASDGSELLDTLNHCAAPDVLVLDISMPVMSGLEALRQIKRKHFTFKILVLTMHKEQDLVDEAFLCGADGYMLKEEMGKALLPALHTILDNGIYISPQLVRDLPNDGRIKKVEE